MGVYKRLKNSYFGLLRLSGKFSNSDPVVDGIMLGNFYSLRLVELNAAVETTNGTIFFNISKSGQNWLLASNKTTSMYSTATVNAVGNYCYKIDENNISQGSSGYYAGKPSEDSGFIDSIIEPAANTIWTGFDNDKWGIGLLLQVVAGTATAYTGILSGLFEIYPFKAQ